MEATKYQVGLAYLLKKQVLDSRTASTIPVILNSEELVCKMLVWLYDTNPNEEQIMHWIVEHT